MLSHFLGDPTLLDQASFVMMTAHTVPILITPDTRPYINPAVTHWCEKSKENPKSRPWDPEKSYEIHARNRENDIGVMEGKLQDHDKGTSKSNGILLELRSGVVRSKRDSSKMKQGYKQLEQEIKSNGNEVSTHHDCKVKVDI